ncbi:SAGA complex protein [Mycena venus]|uniref:SAGA complex protein n=1 Tax=Mycena venus TaxID=2733690 RepID=A0A8H7CWM0_9AGAR|nr:SAGA complex protein [Mycena venus]
MSKPEVAEGELEDGGGVLGADADVDVDEAEEPLDVEQGTSAVALDVLASVASEYLNVGRTIRYLCNKYSQTMTPEETILHTLFKSGISHVQDLERYISDDAERYSVHLGKKLVGAYREVTAVDVLDDEGLFEEEGEALAMGDFADTLGENYLGLRELGIAAEFGILSLSIPKKLLRRKRQVGMFQQPRHLYASPPAAFCSSHCCQGRFSDQSSPTLLYGPLHTYRSGIGPPLHPYNRFTDPPWSPRSPRDAARRHSHTPATPSTENGRKKSVTGNGNGAAAGKADAALIPLLPAHVGMV